MDVRTAAHVAGAAHEGARAVAAAACLHADTRAAPAVAGIMHADTCSAAYRGPYAVGPTAAAGGSVDELVASTWLLPAGACHIPDALRHRQILGFSSAPGAIAGTGPLPRAAPARLPGPDQAHRTGRVGARAGAGRSRALSVRSDEHQRAAGAGQRGAAQTGPRRAVKPQGGLGPSAACGRVSSALREQAAGMQGRDAAGAAARVSRGAKRVPLKDPRHGLGKTGDMCPGHAPSREIDQRAGARKRAGLKEGAASRGWAR